MPIDPSIALQTQAPQIQSPLDIAAKAMTLKNLGLQNQVNQQSFNDDQAVRSAFKNNMTTGPDGQPTINRPGVLSDLAQNAPTKYMDTAGQFRQQDVAAQDAQIKQLQNQHETAAQLAMSIPTGQDVPLAQKNAAYQSARAKAIAAGLPGATQSPQEYPGDTAILSSQVHTMSVKDQFDTQIKQQQMQNESKANQLKLMELQKSIGDSNNKDAQSMSEMLDKGWTARSGQAGTVQAQINQIQDLKTLLAQGKSQPDGLDSRQTAELATGLASLYGKGAAGEEAVHRLMPDTWVGKGKTLQERILNQPMGLDQQEFAQRMEDSVDRVNSVAQEQKKQYQVQSVAPFERLKNTNPQLYNHILQSKEIDPNVMIDKNGKYVKGSAKAESDQGVPSAAAIPATAHPQAGAAVAWAKQNPNDPRAQQIMQRLGQ